MSKLAGKVAIVTGASKGIGASIAKHPAAAGASVVVNYASSKSGADSVVAEIERDGGKADRRSGNVAKQAEISASSSKRTRHSAPRHFGQHAGIYEFAPIETISPEHFDKMFDLNVLGLILASQQAAKRFGPDGGSIINISSVVATSAPPGTSVYSATKGAVDTITRSLAKELGPRKSGSIRSTPAWSRPKACSLRG